MNTEYLIALISIVVEIVLGFVAKKHPKFKKIGGRVNGIICRNK